MNKNLLTISKSIMWQVREYGIGYVYDSYLRNKIFRKTVFLPNMLRIEVTTFCNLKCPTCNYREMSSDFKRHMSLVEFIGIISQVPNVKEVDLTGIGENLINKDFLKMLKFLKNKNIRVKFFDNFTLMKEDIAEEIISIGIDQLRVSIDGVTKETFEKCREGASFEKVISNVKKFAKLKQALNKKKPFFSASFCLSSLNVEELHLLPDFINTLGVDSLLIENSLDLGSGTAEYNVSNEIIVEMDKVKQRCNEIGLMLQLNNFYPGPCNAVWGSVYITSSGDLIKCPHSNIYYERENIQRQRFGNVFHNSFEDIWYSDKCHTYRKMILGGILPGDCKKCLLDPTL